MNNLHLNLSQNNGELSTLQPSTSSTNSTHSAEANQNSDLTQHLQHLLTSHDHNSQQLLNYVSQQLKLVTSLELETATRDLSLTQQVTLIVVLIKQKLLLKANNLIACHIVQATHHPLQQRLASYAPVLIALNETQANYQVALKISYDYLNLAMQLDAAHEQAEITSSMAYFCFKLKQPQRCLSLLEDNLTNAQVRAPSNPTGAKLWQLFSAHFEKIITLVTLNQLKPNLRNLQQFHNNLNENLRQLKHSYKIISTTKITKQVPLFQLLLNLLRAYLYYLNENNKRGLICLQIAVKILDHLSPQQLSQFQTEPYFSTYQTQLARNGAQLCLTLAKTFAEDLESGLVILAGETGIKWCELWQISDYTRANLEVYIASAISIIYPQSNLVLKHSLKAYAILHTIPFTLSTKELMFKLFNTLILFKEYNKVNIKPLLQRAMQLIRSMPCHSPSMVISNHRYLYEEKQATMHNLNLDS